MVKVLVKRKIKWKEEGKVYIEMGIGRTEFRTLTGYMAPSRVLRDCCITHFHLSLKRSLD